MKAKRLLGVNMFNPYEYFKGKNVLLIGNGEKLADINYDNYNSIVRMNLGIQDIPCHVWINNLVNEGHNRLKELPRIQNIVRLNFDKEGTRADRMPDKLKQKAWFWNKEEYNTMTKLYNYNRPTTGFVSIYWLTTHCQCNLTITGFDFFKTKNRYTMEEVQHIGTNKGYNHDVKLEEEVISKLILRGTINGI
jgi:hypothetical protein